MTAYDPPSPELQELLDGLLNQSLNQEQHEQLQHLLKSSEAARFHYLAHVDLHYDLLRIHSQVGDLPCNSDKLLEWLATEDLEGSCDAGSASERAVSPRNEFRQGASVLRSSVVRRLCIAATVLFIVGGSWAMVTGWFDSLNEEPIDRDVQIVGTLEKFDTDPVTPSSSDSKRSSGVSLAQVASAKLYGEPLPPLYSEMVLGREYALTTGMIELKFPQGASAIIEAPAVFVVATDSRLMMKTGICSVHAPDGAQGFRVDTPLADVVDLGTRFVVNVSQSGDTSVQVIEGEAELYPNQADTSSGTEPLRTPINLRSGQANRVVSQGHVMAETTQFEKSTYKPSLPDRIIRFKAVEDSAGAVDELLSVTVQRGGTAYTYDVDELIGIELIHFRSDNPALMVTPKAVEDPKVPEINRRPRSRYLDSDTSLCSGLINPGGQKTPLITDPVIFDPSVPDQLGTPGIGFRFRQPLKNSAGPDLVLFELQTIVNPERGDGFHVSPLRFSPGLRSFSVDAYDIDLASPESRYLSPFILYRVPKVPHSLQEILEMEHFGGSIHLVRAKALAVAIDLSDLGYAPGAEVEGLFFQDNLADGDTFDPVFVGGFPPVP